MPSIRVRPPHKTRNEDNPGSPPMKHEQGHGATRVATMIEIGHVVELTNSILIRYNWLNCKREYAESLAPTSPSANQTWAKQGVKER